ncbi:MAG: histidine phosphatase family protein [Melioribacteraceae bacterium]|nr:histidine phosphatase family protein [Melioribacteraceae bacterium]
MKKLFLVRHGKSSWKHPDLSDYERPLNKRGNRDVPFMAKLLKEQNVSPDLIVSSPALRAITTAEIMALEFGYPVSDIVKEEMIYEADTNELLQIINNFPEDKNIVIMFGHNPGLTLLSNFISDKRIDNIPTCGIVNIDLYIDKWKDVDFDNGKVVSFDYPKKYL